MMQQINLYQPVFRREKKVFSAQAMLEVTVVVVSLLFVYYSISVWNVSRLNDGVVLLKANVKSQQDNLVSLKKEFPQKSKDKLLAKRIVKLQQAIAKNQKILAALSGGGDYGNKSGFSQLLSGFARQHMKGVWLDRLDIDEGGLYLNIQGNAMSADIVPKYIQGLSQDNTLKGRTFSVFQLARKSKDSSHVSFSLSSRKLVQ